jgi:hypothetical protein
MTDAATLEPDDCPNCALIAALATIFVPAMLRTLSGAPS